ncbi:MAG: acyl-CoA dehydrogenase family protein [Myxococcota bacterium]|nr:acyl-CoA dehydrogenase family protein [Myxococcota bacterium]
MLPRPFFNDEHAIFRQSVKQFVEAEIVPHHEAWEEEGRVSRDLWLKAGEIGLLCPDAPEAYGGLGCDFLFNVIVDEELCRVGASGPGFALHSDIVLPYVVHYGTEDQKLDWIPKMVSGEAVTAIAMTEPGAGSDLQGIATTAVKDNGEYIINGSKTFITNGQLADLVLVVAKTDPSQGARGTSLFMVDAKSKGFSRGKNLKKVGMKAQDTSELFFQDMRVPATALLGEENAGFAYLMRELAQERLSVAIMAMASSEGAMAWTTDYVQEREAFGRSIAKFQNTRFKLAEIATKIQVGRTFVDRCIEQHLKGELSISTAAMAKLWSTEAQFEIMDECLQLFGGYGYMTEYPIARAWADSRVQRIYAGTSEIMKELIARSVL